MGRRVMLKDFASKIEYREDWSHAHHVLHIDAKGCTYASRKTAGQETSNTALRL